MQTGFNVDTKAVAEDSRFNCQQKQAGMGSNKLPAMLVSQFVGKNLGFTFPDDFLIGHPLFRSAL